VIPSNWEGFEIRYQHKSATYEIAVRRRAGESTVVELDGKPVEDGIVKLSDDGAAHTLTVWLPRKSMERVRSSQVAGETAARSSRSTQQESFSGG
jgi:hypothetical protein